MADVHAAITEYLREEFVHDPNAVIEPDANLIETEVIDSLGILLMISFVQDRFGVEVDPEEVTVEHFQTVNDIANLVESKMA